MSQRGLAGAVVVAVLAAMPNARADVWRQASGDSTESTVREIYDHALSSGDELAKQANAQGSVSLKLMRDDVKLATDAYRAAAAARPDQAEPYFRIGWLLFSFYFQLCDNSDVGRRQRSLLCDPDPTTLNRPVAQQVIDAWNAAEARAPLDPRFGAMRDDDFRILFERAILNTKFADPKHLEAAARDYETLLARADSSSDGSEVELSNLAETYMMLGRLDDAVDTYGVAVRHGSDISTTYGLAVALDRDERGDQARAIIAELGRENYLAFVENVRKGHSFYVPAGEKYYYLALGEESLGDGDDAISYWNDYIKSPAGAARPQFLPRARANRDALIAKRRLHPSPPPTPADLGF